MTEINPDFQYFENIRPSLLNEHRGQYVLIKDRGTHGFYSSFGDALKKGYEIFGYHADFLIQEITDEQRINYLSSPFIQRSI